MKFIFVKFLFISFELNFKMGRKGLFAEKPKKGPGRKAKKQGAPQLTRQFKGKIIYDSRLLPRSFFSPM